MKKSRRKLTGRYPGVPQSGVGSLWSLILFLILFTLAVLPLLHVLSHYNPYEFPKFVFFLGSVFFCVMLSLFTRPLKHTQTRSKKGTLFFLVTLFILVSFVTNLTGLDPFTSFVGSTWRYQGFLLLAACFFLFLLTRLLIEQFGLKKIVSLSAIFLTGSVGIITIYALVQAYSYYILHNAIVPTYHGRIVATLGNPNFLGGYLATLLPFILFQNNRTSRLLIAFRAILSVGIVITIFFTQSRAAFLAVIVLGIVFLYRLFKRLSIPQKIILSFGIFLCIGVFTLKFQTVSSILTRGSFWDNRVIIWKYGVQAFLKSPFLGYGQENFELILPPELFMKADNAHNIFLETAISSGIAGVLLFLGIFYNSFKRAPYPVKLSLLAFLITAQFNPLSIAQITLFWFLLALY